ncbi:hypothetical protein EZV62_001685 [Acer yangbiense]|uniref:Endonuclease/exonuclease/phosphatase domain-containing protein n=1 Tax=Acer yangbiense TaxID=1000413 RepID=A0A5C7IX59_9ROSI|nr:hypothetical protein EZV62_001685 [Acer yangbiense]
MFHFNKQEDRNRVWQRGPWHFGKSLIALAFPQGSGNISHLDFNKADFWIQIHEIPILCMNRRTAKWMVEQIGEVVEIPADSREYWGKFMRLKITGIFRVGHGIMECLDVEARKLALEGAPTKFGSWLKASIGEKQNSRYNTQSYGSSSEKMRSNEGSKEGEGDGSISVKPGSLASLKGASGSEVAAPTRKVTGTLVLEGGSGTKADEMCVDGPDSLGNSGGLLLLWKDTVDITILFFSSGHIDARVGMLDGFLWHFSGFYGDPIANNRKYSWSLLRRLRDTDNLPWVYGGDFNELLSLNDKVGGSDKNVLVDECNLYDLGFSGPKLTWNNKRDGKHNIQERLDRFLANSGWRDHFKDAQFSHLHLNSFVYDVWMLPENMVLDKELVWEVG